MTEVLLDSDVIIAWLRGRQPAAEVIPELLARGDTLTWTPVSIAEIFAGVRKGEEAAVSKLFLILDTLVLTAKVGKKAGEYLKSYSRSHGVELGDALIAAAAHSKEIPLWTFNRKHYPMKDVCLFDPSNSLRDLGV